MSPRLTAAVGASVAVVANHVPREIIIRIEASIDRSARESVSLTEKTSKQEIMKRWKATRGRREVRSRLNFYFGLHPLRRWRCSRKEGSHSAEALEEAFKNQFGIVLAQVLWAAAHMSKLHRHHGCFVYFSAWPCTSSRVMNLFGA